MDKDHHFGGLIWTHHAIDRVGSRGLTQPMIAETVHHPDSSYSGKKQGTLEYKKKFGSSTVTVIGTRNEKKEIVLLSCWIDPPVTGTADWHQKRYYNEYRNARTWWQKIWVVLKQQLSI